MPNLSPEEAAIEQAALDFARANKKPIAKRLTDPKIYPADEIPVSVFMAGSPGAGKTEASIELLAELEGSVIRIDADALREECEGYTGANAWLFQKATSVLVEKIHDLALEQRQSFLLDGTFSNLERARKNIDRSLGRKRVVQILYVYQEPSLAWQFVKAREAVEGRRVPPEEFVKQYFQAREVVNQMKKEFGSAVYVDLLLKNLDNSNRTFHFGVENIDSHIPEAHTAAQVEAIVKEG